MMAEHGANCTLEEATFCMNGGTCYKISAMNSLSCVCNTMYTGSRCETLNLLVISQTQHNGGMIAAVVIVALLIAVAVAVFIYYIHKKRQARRKVKEQQDSGQQQRYWKVQSRSEV